MAVKYKALVADDMDQNRTAIKAFLFFYKFDVELAKDGLEAKEKYGAGTFDIVFSDIEMPNMNGFEFLTWVKKSSNRKDTPVIMLSSLDSPEIIERCKRIGATSYIVKPFTKEKMEAALKIAGLLS